jgi:putative transposase
VLIRKAFRFRIYPGKEQVARLLQWEDTLRFLWNLAQEQRLIGLARTPLQRRYYTSFDQINQLTELRAEVPWLADVPRNVCAQLLIELDKAWQRCFKRITLQPHWKKKGRDQVNVCEPHPKVWRLDNDSLVFPKIGAIRIILHRSLDGIPKACTLVREVDQWFAVIVCEIELSDPIARTEPIVALDRGVVNLVADSDGNIYKNPRYLQRALSRLAHAQRIVARRRKGSNNQKKARIRVAKLYRTIRRQRGHMVHNLTAAYSKSHGTVVVEKLNIKNMTASAGGTIDEPGKNVAAKGGLNRGILDAAWGMIVNCLRYKLGWVGGRLVEVPAAYSSQTCSVCGAIDPKSRISQSEFRCTSCAHVEHADINAAKVLKFRAVETMVHGCGGVSTRRPTKQQLHVVRRGTRSQGLGSSKALAFRPE